jgi:hypothetical protein
MGATDTLDAPGGRLGAAAELSQQLGPSPEGRWPEPGRWAARRIPRPRPPRTPRATSAAPAARSGAERGGDLRCSACRQPLPPRGSRARPSVPSPICSRFIQSSTAEICASQLAHESQRPVDEQYRQSLVCPGVAAFAMATKRSTLSARSLTPYRLANTKSNRSCIAKIARGPLQPFIAGKTSASNWLFATETSPVVMQDGLHRNQATISPPLSADKGVSPCS